MKKIPYTCEREIRAQLSEQAQFKASVLKKAVDPAVLARWIELSLAKAREAGLLMTEQQLADYRAGHEFTVGDKAKYVGPTRVERVSDEAFERPSGQRGTITNVIKQTDTDIITFRPIPSHKDDHVVELVFRTETKGFLDIEREVR